jgi:cell division GTPase FtsZ
MLFLAISGGGGTGSSSVDTMVPLLFSLGLPLGVIYILPKATEDAQSKKNSIETLSRLAKMTSSNAISSLVVVDNARIEQIYGGLSQSQFWSTANSAIVDPINLFNTLTSRPSQFTSLDPSDFGKIISCGDCSVYGMVEVEDYTEETALAEAVMKSLSSNMLAEGFDLTQTRTGGVIILGSQEALNKLPAINIDYCFSMISDATNGANIFQGIYAMDDMDSDSVKIYSWFAGLGLPQDRIENLKKESKAQASVLAEKEKARASAMSLDLGEDKVSSVKDQIERKIKNKNSGFNKLQGSSSVRSSIIDKRRR